MSSPDVGYSSTPSSASGPVSDDEDIRKRLEELEKAIEFLMTNMALRNFQPKCNHNQPYDCGCPDFSVCNNSICPRAVKVTCSL
jgi:hypothetical protein